MSQAWSPWLVGDKETLEKVQEKAVKMVSGLKSKDYKERCLELGLDTLEKRREEQDMALVHKMALGGQLSKVFEMADAQERPRTRQTEGEYRLIQKFACTDRPTEYSFAVRVVDPWNRLPDDSKCSRCEAKQVQANTYEMDTANHTDETKWLLPAYMVDKPQQPKYSQVSKKTEFAERWRRRMVYLYSFVNFQILPSE